MGRSIINWGGITDDVLMLDSDHPLSNKAAAAEFLRLQNSLVQKELELKALIDQATTAINAVKNMRATTTTYGMTSLTTSTNATEGERALDAVEANGSVPGSLMWFINDLQYLKSYLPKDRGLNWTGRMTSADAQLLFYNYTNNNWCGMGCRADGPFCLRVGVRDEGYEWRFSTDGHLYRNNEVVI